VLFHRLYRVVPRRMRRRALSLLPPARQLWLARRMFRLPDGAARTAVAPASVRTGGRRVRVRVSGDATPQSVREHNLDIVVRALDNAGVGYLCLPRPGLRSAVAVPIEDQPRVHRLLDEDPGLRQARVQRLVAGQPPRGRRRDGGPDAHLMFRVWEPVASESGSWMLGEGYACDVEFWQRVDDRLQGPRPGHPYGAVPRDDEITVAPAWVFNPHLPDWTSAPPRPTAASLARTSVEHVAFPIDAVYTWVDGSDPHWQHRKAAAVASLTGAPLVEEADRASRFASRDELRYSLRSLVCFAPWIRHIYLVTDDQVPPWLDPDHPMVTVVTHRDLFGDTGRLPTFNSHAIETRLHRIPDLAEHFLYLNDDVFLGRSLPASTFFLANGLARFFPSPASIDPLPSSLRDAPVNAAAKNNRQALMDMFGRGFTHKMRHVPHALRRSVLTEIEACLPEAVQATASHQFRHPHDLSMVSSLHHYWSFLAGTSVPGRIRYAYGDIGHRTTPIKLAQMLATRPYDVFCLNDVGAYDDETGEQQRMLAEFLPAYLPFCAPFELSDEETARRAQLSATELMSVPTESRRHGGRVDAR
jgi:hypothetical protein